jgi:Phosphotransferase enzyme family
MAPANDTRGRLLALWRKVGFGLGVARAGAHVLWERLRQEEPTTSLEVLPQSFEHLTTTWLTRALCRGHDGTVVSDLVLGSGSSQTTTRCAITVQYDGPDTRALPEHLFGKLGATLISRVLTGITGAAASECLFYNRIRPVLDVRAPIGYFAAWDPRSLRSLVLVEDVVATRGAEFGVEVDRAGVESMIHELAAFHGAFWDSARFSGDLAPVQDAFTWQQQLGDRIGMPWTTKLGFRDALTVLPSELHHRERDVYPALMRSLQLHAKYPQTLLHQDTHPLNWFRLPDGSMGLCDWQAIARGTWALDFAYAITTILDVEQRRAWERDLLAIYLTSLGHAGGRPPSLEDAWLMYRQQTFHGFVFWLNVLGLAHVAPVHATEFAMKLVERIGAAVADLDALASLDARA